MENEKVLFLGDSITRHYLPYATEFLSKSNIEAVEPEKWVSCQWKQMRMIGQLLQGKRKYGGRKVKAETVHFNFGLHSIKLPHKGHDPEHQRATQEDIDTYEKELIEEIEYLRKLNIKNILFSNTTPSPKNHGVRKDADVVILNEIADRIMRKYDVPLNDLYGFVKSQEDYPRLYMHPRAENNCHFAEHGRELLGKQVGEFVLKHMKSS